MARSVFRFLVRHCSYLRIDLPSKLEAPDAERLPNCASLCKMHNPVPSAHPVPFDKKPMNLYSARP
jgi:hypothetical protein